MESFLNSLNSCFKNKSQKYQNLNSYIDLEGLHFLSLAILQTTWIILESGN